MHTRQPFRRMPARTLIGGVLLMVATVASSPAPTQTVPDLDQCSPDPTRYRTGSNCRTVTVEGFERDFIVDVPDPLPTEPLPLVVVLPDSGADHSLFARVNGFNAAVEAGEVIMVVPHPLPYLVPDRDGDRVWMERWAPDADIAAGTPPYPGYPDSAPWPSDDMAYVAAVIATVQAEIAIDASRIFVTGLGDAGMYAMQLAYERHDLFAAVGVGVAGFDLGLPPDLPPSARTIPVFAMLGNEDPDVTDQFEGGRVPLDPVLLLADPARFAPVLDAFGLAPPPCATDVREDGNIMTIVFCAADGTPGFTFILVRGVGHAGPNAVNNPGRYTYGPEMWRLFEGVRAGD